MLRIPDRVLAPLPHQQRLGKFGLVLRQRIGEFVPSLLGLRTLFGQAFVLRVPLPARAEERREIQKPGLRVT